MTYQWNVINWQDRGYYGLILVHGGRHTITLPRPNMRVPDDLYRTEVDARNACIEKIRELEALKELKT